MTQSFSVHEVDNNCVQEFWSSRARYSCTGSCRELSFALSSQHFNPILH